MLSFYHPTNIASVNLVMGCFKVFFYYCNSPGILTLCKWCISATQMSTPWLATTSVATESVPLAIPILVGQVIIIQCAEKRLSFPLSVPLPPCVFVCSAHVHRHKKELPVGLFSACRRSSVAVEVVGWWSKDSHSVSHTPCQICPPTREKEAVLPHPSWKEKCGRIIWLKTRLVGFTD